MRRVERVIAVDPGKLTGVCVMEHVVDSEAGVNVVNLLESRETGPDDTVPLFRELYDRYWRPEEDGSPRMRVVIEDFKISPRTGEKSAEASWALRTTGAVEQACRDEGYPTDAIVYFMPDKKRIFPNPRLRKLGLWHRGGKGHALDAIRHAAVYLSQTGMLPAAS